MAQHLAYVAIIVPDHEDAIAYYTSTLGFTLVEDTRIGEDRRWVVVAPPGATETGLVLARAATPEQQAAIGRQGAGRVWLFLHTDDFARDHARLAASGVKFSEPPRREPYGIVAVFEDRYGNRWDLLQLDRR